MNTIRLRTPFEVGDKPLAEYPRPQFARDSYINLNGYWDYAIYNRNDEFPGWQGKILVPFLPKACFPGCPKARRCFPTTCFATASNSTSNPISRRRTLFCISTRWTASAESTSTKRNWALTSEVTFHSRLT